jgi:NTP pyrophosphatase (non-canonical NTP hydrolase)
LVSHGGDLAGLRDQLREFARERDWERYHTPRNLLLALVGEVGELAELFQWLGDEQAARIMDDPRQAQQVRAELADVFSYLLRLADMLDVDLGEALTAKMRLNAERYPADLARGNAAKYTDLRTEGAKQKP